MRHKDRSHKHLSLSSFLLRIAACALLIVGLLSPISPRAFASVQAGTERTQAFTAAASEFGVPAEILLAISYNESRWELPGGEPSGNNGYGLMNLRARTMTTVEDGRGNPAFPAPATASSSPGTTFTLDEASKILRLPADKLKNNEQQNIRGAAAVLAQYARQMYGQAPATLDGWYEAVAKYSGAGSEEMARTFADDVYAAIRKGVTRTTSDKQRLSVAAQPALKVQDTSLKTLNLPSASSDAGRPGGGNQQTNCPRTVTCRFIPAAYAGIDPNDPTLYGNYDPANRPHDMKIKYIVIHDAEGSYNSTISWFQNSLFHDPPTFVSANYVIRSNDGEITEMVHPGDVAWHAGNWYMNMHSIGIELEGVAAQGSAWYTEEMYKSTAELVKYLAKRYNIPLDRDHIIGHDNIPRLSPTRMADVHWDPGPYWNWDHFMGLTGAPANDGRDVSERTKVLTISPNFEANQLPIDDCSRGTCERLPAQGSNIVRLRTAPSEDAPLVSDPYLHPDGPPGTTDIDDWGANANSGASYAVADKQGDWTAIWFAGQKAWFYNPRGDGKTAHASRSKTITPRPGLASVSVYAGAYPEAEAFPSTIPVQSLRPLYSIPAGQRYTVASTKEPTDYFYDATVDYSLPDDHMIVRGSEKYYRIMFNHRVGYVKANDVEIR